MLSNKVIALNIQLQKQIQENVELKDDISETKQKNEEMLYETRLIFNQEKSVLREHAIQLENKLTKLEKQFNDSLKR